MKKVLCSLVVLLITCEFECYAQTVSGNVREHDYVDLELPSGRLWATCNVGATKPTEYGDYFAWGEVEPKKEFTWSNYKWGKEEGQFMTKYCLKSTEGKVDKKTELEKEDDAASYNWGSAWRIPTIKEEEELLNGCNWEWTNNFEGSGIAGRVGHSKKNGNVIFLPAGGAISGDKNSTLHEEGYYWSSTLFKNTMNGSYFLCFANYFIDWRGNKRFAGRNVRAVVSENVVVSKKK
ncbi:MAG: hypothetical protein MJY63_04085 [Paludibacteraceae bacterium]|nr:hypothetical protein [Paludibacteraceae bacterium]